MGMHPPRLLVLNTVHHPLPAQPSKSRRCRPTRSGPRHLTPIALVLSLCLVSEPGALGLTGFLGCWLGCVLIPAFDAPNQARPHWTLVTTSSGERGWAGVGKPLTLPLGRWHALRAASTRLRSAGNIWKKLKEQRKVPGKERGQTRRGKALRSWVEVWEKSWGNSLFHGNLPFRIELHLELYQAGGAESSSFRPWGWHT